MKSGTELTEEIAKAVEELDEARAQALVKEILEKPSGLTAAFDGVVAGLKSIGHRFEKKDYFLLELMEGGDIGKRLMDMISPHLPKKEGVKPARIVIGTVRSDIHDIGKNLVTSQLQISGFEVYDLGVDVPSMAFVDRAEEVRADIIAMSAFTTNTMPRFTEVLGYLEDMGLRGKYLVIIGGGTSTQAYAEQVEADGWAPDAVQAVALCESLLSRKAGV